MHKVSRANKKSFSFKKKNFSDSLGGFTMIELLIALAVFMIGIMAAFSLSLHNLNTTKENSNRVIAANLAREGIETVRNIRDSNWLAREANVMQSGEVVTWHEGLDVGKVFSIANYDSDSLVTIIPLFPPIPIADGLNTAISRDVTKLYINDLGFYTHSVTTKPTAFRRALYLQAICLSIQINVGNPTAPRVISEFVYNSNSSFSCGTPANGQSLTKIGFKVTSRVQYTYGSRTNTIDAEERIYNWRQ